MRKNIVFVSNCDLYKDLIRELLAENNKYVDYYFSCCDAANTLNAPDIDLFLVAHEFVEDSIQDYQEYCQNTPDHSKTHPIILCDEFELDDANEVVESRCFSEAIVVRPLEDKAYLLEKFVKAITIANTRQANEQSSENTPSSANQTDCILVIEDDSFFSDIYIASLAFTGLNVVVVEDCNSACEAIYSNPPKMVFLDYNLPDFNGFEFLRTIRSDSNLNGVPVVVVTGDSNPELDHYSRQIGATKFLKKPIKPKEISEVACSLLGSKLAVS